VPTAPVSLQTGIRPGLLVRGFLGSVLLALSGPGAGAVPTGRDAVATFLHLDWVRESASLRVISAVLALIGVILLASAWWQLRRALESITPREILVVASLWALPLLVATPLFSRDVYAYAGQGNLVANDIDPYTYGPNALFGKWSYNVDAVWRDTPSPYGPVWLWVAGGVVRLSADHVVPALFMFRVLSVLGLVLIAWALPRLAASHGIPPQRALWLGVANPFMLIHGIGGAHNDTLMIGLLVCGLAVATHQPTLRRVVLATVLITVAALVKLPAIAALAFLPMAFPQWGQRFRAAGLIAATAAATAVLLTSATGLGWGWLGTLDGGSARLSIFSPVTGFGVAVGNFLQNIGLVQTPTATYRLVIAAALGVTGIVALVLLLRTPHIGILRALGLTLVAAVALGPIVQPWYLLWGLVLLAAVGGERTTLALGALSIALCLAVLPNGKSLIRPPFYGAPLLAAAAVAAFEVRRSVKMVLDDAHTPQEPATAPA
jgi:hypothetical protein